MLPIQDYAMVGDCHGSALIGRDGSVGWCAFERFDADPALFGLLDRGQGGAFVIEPAEAGWRVERSYLRGTNLLETVFICGSGRFSIIDFMPLGRRTGAGLHDYVDLLAPHALIRKLSGVEGRVAVRASWRSAGRFKAAAQATDPRPLLIPGGDMPWQKTGDEQGGDGLVAAFTIERGQSRFASVSPRRSFDAEECGR
ncbi:MAG: DUF5911 domain-containing protein, partial [Pseudomonadota bacterium]|nr:DUF5911 domain-containing protein [Pseudomonadota bacterium]